LRILLVARQDLTASGTAQTNRLLRALLLAGDDTDRRLARGVPPGSSQDVVGRGLLRPSTATS
jgi:hypothetical protein